MIRQMAEAQVGPFGGYLIQVTDDYFKYSGLRGSHNAVFNGMDPATQEAVQPYMPDLKPVGNLTPPLLQELPRATLGAWGNYLGDMYNGGGGVASTEARRDVAIGSTLIMGMLAADEATWRESPGARTLTDVALFYASMRRAIAGESTLINNREEFSYRPYKATQLLAQEVHSRVVGTDEERKGALVTNVQALADARQRQFSTGRGEIGLMSNMALDLGEATARIALDLTTLRPEVKAAPPNEEGEIAAIALGKIGAILTHGTHVDAAFRDGMPTYATAIIMNGYGPTKKAIASIKEHRNEAVHELVQEGTEALHDSTRQAKGIFRMAVRLLKIRQGHGGIGSAKAIEQSMRENTYWNEHL